MVCTTLLTKNLAADKLANVRFFFSGLADITFSIKSEGSKNKLLVGKSIGGVLAFLQKGAPFDGISTKSNRVMANYVGLA